MRTTDAAAIALVQPTEKMATLTVRPAAAPAPSSWDETIVPTLRKRLEAESRVLTKRMSMISVNSADEGRFDFSDYRQQQQYDDWGRPTTPQLDRARASPIATRPSAIPRPSLSRGINEDVPSPTVSNSKALGNGLPAQVTRGVRQRTQSTPGLSGIPTPVASRSNSPMVPLPAAKSSRIPTPTAQRALAPGIPAVPKLPNGLGIRNGSSPGTQPNSTSFPPSPDTSPEFGASSEAEVGDVSFNMSVYSKQSGDIMHETPPFDRRTRLSLTNDDGERPFEHWYRGESRRNGGVGEVRVAKHEEMMEIATYGHRMGVPTDFDARSGNGSGGRRRAGTLTQRGSWFDESTQGPQVLDEQPLTDVDTQGTFSDYSRPTTPRHTLQHKASAYYSPEEEEADMQWRQIEQRAQPELARKPSQKSQLSIDTSGASAVVAKSPGPRSAPIAQSTPQRPTQQQPRQQPVRKQTGPMTPAQKVVATSQQRGRGGAAKRGAPPSNRSKSAQALSRSAPEPGQEPIEYEMDAIPVWTQPKTGANWDDVVLPAVAKKMGIQDGYEQQDGTPRPRRRESADRIAPAPGTFGFDDTKMWRGGGGVRAMQLDEFGGGTGSGTETEGQGTGPSDNERQLQTEPIVLQPPTTPGGRVRNEPPPSPMPFSAYQNAHPRPLQPSRQYAPDLRMQEQQRQEQQIQYQEQQVIQQQLYAVEKKPEEESGCCRCVIM